MDQTSCVGIGVGVGLDSPFEQHTVTTAMPPLETTRLLIRPCVMDDLEARRQLQDLDAAGAGPDLRDQLAD